MITCTVHPTRPAVVVPTRAWGNDVLLPIPEDAPADWLAREKEIRSQTWFGEPICEECAEFITPTDMVGPSVPGRYCFGRCF